MALRAGHAAERIGQSRWNRKNQHDFKKVREWSRIFKRMRAVSIEKSTPVGTEFLDYLLRGHRSLRDHLLSHALRTAVAVCTRDMRRVRLNQLHRRMARHILPHTFVHDVQRTEHEDP